MVLLLVLPWLMGVMLADRVLKLHEPVSALSVGWAAGWLYTTMGVNFCLLAGLSMDRGIALTFGLSLVVALLTLKLSSRRWTVPKLGWPTWCFLIVGALAVHMTTNTILFLNPDDDFFLHAPLQGQLLKGTFPVINPYFSDIPYGGHYARDLLTVIATRLSGLTLYASQSPVTVSLQLAAFLVLFSALLRQTGCRLQAVLGTTFVMMGANAGFRGGWLDTVANNNALNQMTFALCIFVCLEALFGTGPQVKGAAVMAGLSLGGLAWAYETNFALACLGLCGLALTTFLLRSLTRRQVMAALAIVAITLPLAMVQGGVFHGLLAKFRGGGAIAASAADPTLQSQNLEVSVKFPKARLFQIKLDRSGEEMSMAYSTLPFFRDLPKPEGTPGYVSVFSPYAMRIHWLGLYLCPLSLWLLCRRRAWAGILLWWIGFAGYFLPSVVDFGLWEAEVFRWEYVASWGFSGALGVALAQWWTELEGPLWSTGAGRWTLRGKGVAAIALGLLVVANTYPAFHQMRQRTAQLKALSDGLLFPSTLPWLARQPGLDLHPEDARAALWLSEHAGKDSTLLSDFRDENEFNVYFESAFLALCGLRPLGHTVPLGFERLGTRPFRQNAVTRAFWASLDPALLGNLDPDWLYVRGRPLGDVQKVEGLTLAFQSGDAAIFQSSVPPLVAGPDVPDVALSLVAPLPPLEVEQPMKVAVRLSSDHRVETATTFSYTWLSAEGRPVDSREEFLQPVALDIAAGGWQELSLHVVTPHEPGTYRLQGRLGKASLLGKIVVEVGNRVDISGLELLSAEPLDSVFPGQVARFRLRLLNPSSRAIRTARPVLAALVAKEKRPLYQIRDFVELSLEIPAGGVVEVELASVVPDAPNGFELMLLPRDGWTSWTLPASDPPRDMVPSKG